MFLKRDASKFGQMCLMHFCNVLNSCTGARNWRILLVNQTSRPIETYDQKRNRDKNSHIFNCNFNVDHKYFIMKIYTCLASFEYVLKSLFIYSYILDLTIRNLPIGSLKFVEHSIVGHYFVILLLTTIYKIWKVQWTEGMSLYGLLPVWPRSFLETQSSKLRKITYELFIQVS